MIRRDRGIAGALRALALASLVLAACSAGEPAPASNAALASARAQPAPPAPAITDKPSADLNAAGATTASSAAPGASAAPSATAAASDAVEAPAGFMENDELRQAENPPSQGKTARIALLGGGELVIAALPPDRDETAPRLTLAIVANGKVTARIDGTDDLLSADAKQALSGRCETFDPTIRREDMGGVEVLRVSVGCSVGEDYQTNTEIVALFREDAKAARDLHALTRLWTGIGDGSSNEMDSCLTSRVVSFRILKETTLEKTSSEQARWIDQTIPAELKRDLRKDCKVGSRKKVEQIKLTELRM